jgi:hypothetical protein
MTLLDAFDSKPVAVDLLQLVCWRDDLFPLITEQGSGM